MCYIFARCNRRVKEKLRAQENMSIPGERIEGLDGLDVDSLSG